MWKHLAGIAPAAPGFTNVTIAPRIHDSVGPRSVGGQYLSPKGLISTSWTISGVHTVRLSVTLPVGVAGATIMVPKPTKGGQPALSASVSLAGRTVWNGVKLVGTPGGIFSARDVQNSIEFTTTNGEFVFVCTAKSDGWMDPRPQRG